MAADDGSEHERAPDAGRLTTGIRAGVLAYALWGLLTIYWKQLTGFDAFELIAWRILGTTVVMAIIITLRGRWSVIGAAVRSRRLLLRLAAAAVLLTLNWGAYVWAIVHDRIIETALGYFMAPLGTMLLGVLVLHEHPGRWQKMALGCAALAVAVLTISYGRPPIVALLIAASWSVYGLLKRQIPLTAVESLAGETFLLAGPALLYAAVAAAAGDGLAATATAGDWVLVSLSGVVTAVPLLLFAVAAQRVPFTVLGPLQYLVPTITFALGWLVYGEALPADRLVGFAIVWLALLLVALEHVRPADGRDREAVPGYTTTSAG